MLRGDAQIQKPKKSQKFLTFPEPPPYIEKSEPKIKKSFIAFLDTMSYDWDFKIILYFSPLKSGKDLEYF